MDTILNGTRVTRRGPLNFPGGDSAAFVVGSRHDTKEGRMYLLTGLGWWREEDIRPLYAHEADNMNTNTDRAQIAALGEATKNVSIEGIETLEELEAIPEDVVNRPSHYTKWLIEPITYIMRNGFEFWRGNIVKYVSRAGSKLYEGQDEVQSEIIDLKKVIRYAEMRINMLNGETVL